MNQRIAIYLLGMDETTSNEELSAGPYKKLNVHKRVYFPFKSTILLQFISNATIYSTPKMVISIINTESVFKTFFLSYKSSTLCGFFFFFLSESGSAYLSPLELASAEKLSLKFPES